MGTQLPPWKGAQQPPPPAFWPMSIVAKLSPISSTAELLLCLFCVMVSFNLLIHVRFCCAGCSFFSIKLCDWWEERLQNDLFFCGIEHKTLSLWEMWSGYLTFIILPSGVCAFIKCTLHLCVVDMMFHGWLCLDAATRLFQNDLVGRSVMRWRNSTVTGSGS